MEFATAEPVAVFKDIPVPLPPRVPVMWKNTSSELVGMATVEALTELFNDQLTFEAQVAPELPSQNLSTAWVCCDPSSAAMAETRGNEKREVDLSFMVFRVFWCPIESPASGGNA
jgi:hypothetical protein